VSFVFSAQVSQGSSPTTESTRKREFGFTTAKETGGKS
jgi:hypothetical protein